jgi:hypothetical protein
VVEHHVHRVQLLGGAQDLLHLAAAGVKPRIGLAAPAFHHAKAQHAGALHQAYDLLGAFLVVVVAEIEGNDDRRLGIGGRGGAL